jgi:23S rRNA U2552 (ribose-2'-O)-methylase RlmE/FtsJ
MDYLSKKILSENYYNYIKKYYFISKYDNLNKLLKILDPYLYINNGFKISSQETYKFIKTKYKLYKIKDLLINYNILILQYQPFFLSYFFHTYEEIIKFKLIDKKKSISILEITNLPNVFEACYYYEKNKKNNINRSDYTVDLFLNYSGINFFDKKEEYLEYYNQYIKNIKINEITTYFTNDMFINITHTYDLIFTNINYLNYEILPSMQDITIFNLYIYQLYYALLRLNIGGHLVFPVLQIRNKKMADLVLLISSYFTNYELYTPEIKNRYKFSTVFVIYKSLIINKFDMLKEIFYQSYKEDNTGIKIKFAKNINDFNFNKNKIIKSKYIDENYKYVDSLLDTDIDNPIYDKIKAYNKKIYFLKSLYLETINNYVDMNDKEKEIYIKNLKKEQLINALLYAKKWGFKTIPFEKGEFKSDFGNLIIKDMYSTYNGFSYKFSKHTISNQSLDKLIVIPKNFVKLKTQLEMADYTIDTRNIYDWDNLKKVVRFYRPNDNAKHLKTIIEKKFNQKSISQAWVKMYEIIVKYDLIKNKNNTYKTFHLCEAPGNFISATNHYIKTQTNIEIFDWYAQTLNPFISVNKLRAFKDDFNYIRNYNNRWKFGYNDSGDIMDIENIKWYRKYTLDRNVDLITSDCGIPENFGFDSVIKLHCAQLIFILYNLPDKSSCVAKMKIPIIHSLQVELYYKYYQSFDKLYFYKGNQNPSSKEFYLVGIGYNRSILEKELDSLLQLFKNYDTEYDKDRKFPESFIFQLEKIYGVLVDNYIFNFERKLYYVDNYKNIDKSHFDLLDKIINKKNEEWIADNNLVPIKDKDKL